MSARRISVSHVVQGRLVQGSDTEHASRDLGASFATPKLDLDALVWPRSQLPPASAVPVAEVVDLLVETGQRLDLDRNEFLQEALASMVEVNPLGHRILENCYRDLGQFLDRGLLEFEIDQTLGRDAIDGWRAVREPNGRISRVRAFPPRIVHVLAGNGPGVAALTIGRAALTKGVHLLKLPSNDLFTATAILRTMSQIDPTHPVVRSFSAAYWRGGDERVESILYRSQYFDKLVAWGGEAAIRHAVKYLGPGFELITFDPKVSMSLIGREAFASDETLRAVAALAAADVSLLNQDACTASRHQFVEAGTADVDRYCALLAEELAIDRRYGAGRGPTTPPELRDATEVLREMEPLYRVFGGYDGRGLVVRSDEPVDFHPTAKTVNVVPVDSLADAVPFASVATQTVGVYPASRKTALRDALASAGVQRVVPLGGAMEGSGFGLPHDAMYPVHRFVRWVADEGATD
jgi:hypothetical protein